MFLPQHLDFLERYKPSRSHAPQTILHLQCIDTSENTSTTTPTKPSIQQHPGTSHHIRAPSRDAGHHQPQHRVLILATDSRMSLESKVTPFFRTLPNVYSARRRWGGLCRGIPPN
ncbi:hypothetical protein E2C01_072768 [Portunus trituberculatus]|uniref:Uncharacterized protein n=1 Tax=Portunus trituberculatus TaxID=210409 RepID=A0A5B7I7J3_PORTR|nr:hypothetical protein [Portunus trituberculatus]